MNFIKNINKFYQRIKNVLVYLDIVFVIIVFYGDKYLGNLAPKLLPAAVAGAFAILLETLFSINDSLKEKEQEINYSNVNMAFPKIVEIFKEEGHRKHSIKIIASSGGTTINSIVPQLIQASKVPIEVYVLMIDPDASVMPLLPKHWPTESQISTNRLKDMIKDCKPKSKIICYYYDYIPCIRGYLIDDNHLVLGFFDWEKIGNKLDLQGALNTHVYYKRTANNEYLFHLFENWFDNSPKKQVFP